MDTVSAVILAAGQSGRMGFPKLTIPIEGIPMIARVIAACVNLPKVVVASPSLATTFTFPADVRILINEQPDLGMSHSLSLANSVIDPAHALLVLPADKPYISASLIASVLAAFDGVDVVFPERDGIGGHPVIFGPRARAMLVDLPLGDTLQTIRDAPDLRRRIVPTTDRGAFLDIDYPGAIPQAPE